MQREDLEQTIYAKIDTLPTLPSLFPRLLHLMEEETTSTADVAEALSHDPALTSSVLRVANSAYYGFPRQIASLEKAVTLLGFNMVKSLALSIGVLRNLPAVGSGEAFSEEGLWAHSLAVATAMERLASLRPGGRPAEHLFVTGLLHDIGQVVLIAFFPEGFLQAVDAALGPEGVPLHVAEREAIGLDHGEVGGLLLGRWKLPAAVTDPIASHHAPSLPAEADPVDLALLRVSDALAQQLGIGEGGNRTPPPVEEQDLRALGIEGPTIEAVRAHLEKSREGILDFFQALG